MLLGVTYCMASELAEALVNFLILSIVSVERDYVDIQAMVCCCSMHYVFRAGLREPLGL